MSHSESGPQPDMQLFEQDLGFTQDLEIEIRHDVLRNAQRATLSHVLEPFVSPITLKFDEGRLVALQLEAWQEELIPQANTSILAKITFVLGDSIPGMGRNDVYKRVIIDGASVEGTMGADDVGVIARDCNLNYRQVEMRELTFFDPLKPGKMLKGKELRSEQERVRGLFETGWVREAGGKLFELCPVEQGNFTPPIRQLFETNETLPVFPEND